MIDYRSLGFISEKQHTICTLNGQMLAEHVITRDGFNDQYSILYQKRAPTHETKAEIYKTDNPFFPAYIKENKKNLTRRHFKTPAYKKTGTLLQSRATLMVGDHCTVGTANVSNGDDKFFCNADADEIYFVAEGSGVLQTIMGEIDFAKHDYLFVPKAIPYKFKVNEHLRLLIVEGKSGSGIPKDFRNTMGQIKLDAPYNHRDFRSPSRLLEESVYGNSPIIIKRHNELTVHEYTDFPYQVVGWDGWYWPFAFNVHQYQPKTSNVHLPPSIHVAFAGRNFYIMNFVPRLVDYHPKAVPCPWPHSNIDCDEILFYAEGNFTSRKGIEQYSISYHPPGIPHGPHPEKYENSVGVKHTDELTIMVDTFETLVATEAVSLMEDPSYHYTWNTKEHL